MNLTRQAAVKLAKKLGLKTTTVTKQSKHLSYSHPSMEAVRRFVDKVTSTNYVDARLVGNFDQVWSVHYEPPRKVWHKSEDAFGQVNQKNPKRSLKKIIENLEIYMGVSSESSSEKNEVCQPVQLNAAGSMNPVDYARNARTVTTLSWRDGDLGRAWVTISPGSMSLP